MIPGYNKNKVIWNLVTQKSKIENESLWSTKEDRKSHIYWIKRETMEGTDQNVIDQYMEMITQKSRILFTGK